MLERIQKWLALRRYRATLGYLLVDRYGRERHYTPPQVLTTIKRHRLSERYAAYACAMFCSKGAYDDFVAINQTRIESRTAPLTESSVPLWADVPTQEWPEHHHVTAELQHVYGFSQHHDLGVDHSDHFSGHFSEGYDHHGHSHDGSGHDAGGHGGSSD